MLAADAAARFDGGFITTAICALVDYDGKGSDEGSARSGSRWVLEVV
jgi:hypothetical protein